jgi:serine protease inhibitor
MTKNDHEILEELYVNSKIKQAIKKLVKEGKSKDEIEQILSESGYFNKSTTKSFVQTTVTESKSALKPISTEEVIYKKDYVLMKSLYDQVINK